MKGQGNLELALEKKERKKIEIWPFLHNWFKTCIIIMMVFINVLLLVR